MAGRLGLFPCHAGLCKGLVIAAVEQQHHPGFARELAIVRRRLPGVSERLAEQVTTLVQALRSQDLLKPPGVAETIDWTEALDALGATEVDAELAVATLGSVLKYREDAERAKGLDLAAVLAARGA